MKNGGQEIQGRVGAASGDAGVAPETERPARKQDGTAFRLHHVDGLRGLAISLVLVTHIWVLSGAPALCLHFPRHPVTFAAIPAVGYVGVNLFLVLSGFCLAWPFFRDPSYRDRMTSRRFFGRRIRRIVPAYYISIPLVIAIIYGWETACGKAFAWPTWPDLGWHLGFIHNLSVDHASTINGPYWSLALEFQLYLLFPLLYEGMRRWTPVPVLAICLLIQLVYRIRLEQTLPANVLVTYDFVLPKAFPGRMMDFVSGMAVAYGVAAQQRGTTLRVGWTRWLATIALATAFVATVNRLLPQSIIDVAWSCGFGALVWWASDRGWCNRLFCWRWLVWLGGISYSVYLLHMPLSECVCGLIRRRFKPDPSFILALTALPLIIAACYLFYAGCEKVFLDGFAARDRRREHRPKGSKPATFAGKVSATEIQA